MAITETLNEGLKRGYTIKVTAAELDATVNTKLKEAQPNIELKGFRKGKVPMAMLKKQHGPALLGEVMQETVDGEMNSHLEKSGDRPAGQPEMKMTNENWKEGDDVEVSVAYECLPIVPEVDFSKIKLNQMVVKAGDDDIKEALDNLAETSQDYEDKKAGSKAKDGDQVVINFLGKVDGEAFDGGQADDYPLVLGSNSFIPGFEEQLIGSKAGDDVVVNVSFPGDYGAENLAGKDAVFSCKINTVKSAIKAEINDELAKKFGAEDLSDLKNKISERLEEEFKGASRIVMKRDLMDSLEKLVDFELPESLVKTEAGQIAHQLWHEENPEVEGHDHPEIETTDEHTKLAIRRVRLGLLLAEVGNIKEITVSDTEMQQAVIQQSQQYGSNAQQFFEYVQKNPQVQQQIRAPLFEEKVVDYIVSVAKMTDNEVSKEDLQKAVEALED
ncbi:trigger factor [Amylibacter sp.]|jgi:trigger factor|nr:trigger factor [Amylibacter sp.]MDA8760556.1 trigger factor [Amylibacter sp.]MDA8853548.1 trigger factor [Amylibacter sp.]MDA9004765.1 trigger factor [Amylibacter sp.]MDA9926400.1 trigger factor [Amylibacter sp.]|tara:strand:- start:3798 stop:5126 length:1329 start_codon:yes stop_codon:yes gene_type:complete